VRAEENVCSQFRSFESGCGHAKVLERTLLLTSCYEAPVSDRPQDVDADEWIDRKMLVNTWSGALAQDQRRTRLNPCGGRISSNKCAGRMRHKRRELQGGVLRCRKRLLLLMFSATSFSDLFAADPSTTKGLRRVVVDLARVLPTGIHSIFPVDPFICINVLRAIDTGAS